MADASRGTSLVAPTGRRWEVPSLRDERLFAYHPGGGTAAKTFTSTERTLEIGQLLGDEMVRTTRKVTK